VSQTYLLGIKLPPSPTAQPQTSMFRNFHHFTTEFSDFFPDHQSANTSEIFRPTKPNAKLQDYFRSVATRYCYCFFHFWFNRDLLLWQWSVLGSGWAATLQDNLRTRFLQTGCRLVAQPTGSNHVMEFKALKITAESHPLASFFLNPPNESWMKERHTLHTAFWCQ